ncbi:MAG TPA: hypothetical protein VKB78_04090, partial [Pirellulales bacterium]|nr:hypothetical protein [Pirellulales bacterium]
MSRLFKVSSVGAVGAIVAALVAPASAFAKGGSGPRMGGFHSSGASMSGGFSGVSKGVSNFQLYKGLGNSPITKNVGNLPIT